MFPAILTTLLYSVSAVAAARMTRLLGGVEANFLVVQTLVGEPTTLFSTGR